MMVGGWHCNKCGKDFDMSTEYASIEEWEEATAQRAEDIECPNCHKENNHGEVKEYGEEDQGSEGSG